MKIKIKFQNGTAYTICTCTNYGVKGYFIEGYSIFCRTAEEAIRRAFFWYYLATRQKRGGSCLPNYFKLPEEMVTSKFEWDEYEVRGIIEEYVPSFAA